MTFIDDAEVHPVNPNTGRLAQFLAAEKTPEGAVIRDSIPDLVVQANEAVQKGQVAEAAEILNLKGCAAIERWLGMNKDRTDVMYMTAKLLWDAGMPRKAEAWYRRLVFLEPHPEIYRVLGDICAQDLRRKSEAVAYYHQGVKMTPDEVELWVILGKALVEVYEAEKGLQWLRKAAEERPDNPWYRMSCLWYENYHIQDRAYLFEQYSLWAEQAFPMSLARTSHTNDPDPDRRLKVAFLSPDFQYSPAALMFEIIIASLQDADADVYGYGNVEKPDETTERFKESFTAYRDIYGQEADAVVSQIEADGIDILIEIGGASIGQRLDVLARKPAPVQVDFGSIHPMGMRQIDYRITDPCLDPPETAEFYSEKLVNLPSGQFFFTPPHDCPEVGPQPAQAQGWFTFGAFNRTCKVTRPMLVLWAQILRTVPQSRLVLRCPSVGDPGVEAMLYQLFQEQGVSQDRIQLLGFLSKSDYYQALTRVDLALDTFPYSGCSTLMTALWMGVPTLTLSGGSLVSRAGHSVLSMVGLDRFVAESAEMYLHKAEVYAKRIEDLASMRASLRERLLASPLCDKTRCVEELMAAFRSMWKDWCQEMESSS